MKQMHRSTSYYKSNIQKFQQILFDNEVIDQVPVNLKPFKLDKTFFNDQFQFEIVKSCSKKKIHIHTFVNEYQDKREL